MKIRYSIGDVVYYDNGTGNRGIAVISYINYDGMRRKNFGVHKVRLVKDVRRYILTIVAPAKNSQYMSEYLLANLISHKWVIEDHIKPMTRGQMVSEMIHCDVENVRKMLNERIKRWRDK